MRLTLSPIAALAALAALATLALGACGADEEPPASPVKEAQEAFSETAHRAMDDAKAVEDLARERKAAMDERLESGNE